MHRSSFVGALVFIPRAFAALRTRGAFVFIQPPGNNGPPAICSTVANLINDFTILRRRAEEITAAALALDRRFLTGDRAGDLLRTGDRAGDLRTGDLRFDDLRFGDLRFGDLRAGDLRTVLGIVFVKTENNFNN